MKFSTIFNKIHIVDNDKEESGRLVLLFFIGV